MRKIGYNKLRKKRRPFGRRPPRTAAKREYTMQAFEILLPLALILCLSKLMGLGAHRIGMPAVIGMLEKKRAIMKKTWLQEPCLYQNG